VEGEGKRMSRNTPDQIIAHVDLLRAVDRLLELAQVVRQKRETLDQLLTPNPSDEATLLERARQGMPERNAKEVRDAD
jgi:hypothetical protein